MNYVIAGLLVLFLIALLVGLIVERNIERKKCKAYLSEVYDHDPGTD